jgi:AraC-like DNA-binding protein
MDVIAVLLMLGAVQGILLAFVLISRRSGSKIANQFLAAIVTIFSLSILIHTLSHTTQYIRLPYHQELIQIFYFLFGPFVLFYVNALTTVNYRTEKSNILHLIPAMIAFIVYLPFYFIAVSKDGVPGSETTVLGTVISWILLVHLLVYLFLSFRRLLSHSRAIKNSFSSLERINLNWLKFFLSGFVLLWIVALYLDVARSDSQSINFMWLLVSLFMYVIGYMGLWQPDIFAGSEFREAKSAPKKYEKSTLSEENAEKHLEQLSQFMTAEKPFLDSDISLYGLAKKLSIPPHHLSQIINEKLGQNFFEFINGYRVEEAKVRLYDPQNAHLTIAAIGLDSGFNSISAFNAAFKKHAGMSPSQFRVSPRQ